MRFGALDVSVNEKAGGAIDVSVDGWKALVLRGLSPSLEIDGKAMVPTACKVSQDREARSLLVEYVFPGSTVLSVTLNPWDGRGVRLRPVLRVGPGKTVSLNRVTLLGTSGGDAPPVFGADPARIRVMEQGNYWGRVRSLVATSSAPSNAQLEPNGPAAMNAGATSQFVWAAYDRTAHMGLVVGFLTSERWVGCVGLEQGADGAVARWRIGFDGGDTLLEPLEEVRLEEVALLTGPDPWELLEGYADSVRAMHQPQLPGAGLVSWCSWYAYRLGVTEERMLENARLAAQRLKSLGLSVMVIDLGWQQGNLPSTLTENERFPHGLKWLSEELRKLGFTLGVWGAPYCVSEFDPVAAEHPEFLVQGEDGKPHSFYDWFWKPFGKVYFLDLSHHAARQWLKQGMESLAARGVGYLKSDFIGDVSAPPAKRRFDRRVVAGGGYEAARMGAAIIRRALPNALLLNCGGPEMPGTGHWPLLYACEDTGNSGFIRHSSQQANYLSLACHLFKNGRWGTLQPSCLCVGLPGTVEDARLRATTAFLTGGQIDVSDTLTTLPEERWAILTATIPVLGTTARPVDLFDPILTAPSDYTSSCKGNGPEKQAERELPPGSVWTAHVVTDWDEWDIVGLFCFAAGSSADKPEISRFCVPFARLGINDDDARWGYEFWSGHFLGQIPGRRANADGYAHPGDFQDLSSGGRPDMLDVSFFGPCAKLVCLRKVRRHPWVAGTSFHQSCGAELSHVAWNPASAVLSGELRRPSGESGWIVVSASGFEAVAQEVDGRQAPLRHGANQSLVLPVTMAGPSSHWSIAFARKGAHTDAD